MKHQLTCFVIILSFSLSSLGVFSSLVIPSHSRVHAQELFQRNQPDLIWETTFGGRGDDRGVRSVFCPKENCFYSVGTTIEIAQLNSSIYIVKSDKDGGILWERNYGSHSNNSAVGVFINHQQELIVTSNVMNVSKVPEPNNISIMRLNYQGQLIEEIVLHSKQQQYVSRMLQLSDQSYLILGSIYDETDLTDEIFLLKLNSLLEVEWQKTIASEALLTAHDLVVSSEGYIVLSTMLDTRGQMKILLLSVDPQGNILWKKNYGDHHNYMGSSLIKSTDQHYIIMGETDAYGDEVGIILMKIDEKGHQIWEKFHRMKTSTIGRSIIETCNQGFLIAGATDISIEDILYSSGKANAYLLFVDSFGNMLWENTFGGSSHDFLLHILKLPDNSFLLTGRSSSFSKSGDMDLYMLYLGAFVYDKPVMSIEPQKLYFGVLEKNSSSPVRIVYISNDGLGNLNGYINSLEPWINTTDSTFIIPTFGFLALPVSVDPKQMKEGNYTGKIALQTNGGDAEIEIFVDIIDNSPYLSVEPSYLDFGTIQSRENLKQNLRISNQGRQNLFGSLQSSQPWLHVSQDRFVANQIDLEIEIDPARLRNGIQQAELSIQSNGGNKKIPIRVECQFPIITLILTIGQNEALLNQEKLPIDPNNPHVVPLIRQGRTLVPLRFLAEVFGAQVAWNPDLKTIQLENAPKKISIWLQVNNTEAKINTKPVLLDVPPMIIENRVFVPLRFLAESFDAEVSIDQSDSEQAMKIIITYEK
jgi:hypothetical protein